jgi:transposase-like protein
MGRAKSPKPDRRNAEMNAEQKTDSRAALEFYRAAANTMTELACRWADEFKYEDIEDYRAPIATVAAQHGVVVEKMCKRPFGCEFAVDGRRFLLSVNLTRSSYSYRRIA